MRDEPIIYGDDCPLGWDVGETPKYIYARFSLMEKCPDNPPTFFSTPPNDRVFKMTQDPVQPCNWLYTGTKWSCGFEIDAAPLRTYLWLRDVIDLTPYFQHQPAELPSEGFVFHNEILACPGWFGAHVGIAVVAWNPQATNLLTAMNIKKSDKLFLEQWPREDGKLVYKFCRLQDATNIKILFQP